MPHPRPKDFAEQYDAAIFRGATRRLYGETTYYNVGDWSGGARELSQAAAALVERHAAAAERIDARLPEVVLDLGCGLGDGTALLAQRWPAALVVGINLSSVQIASAARRFERPAWAVMDAARLAAADASVDRIISVEAAFHFASRADFLSCAWRVLRPGGVLVLSDLMFADPGAVGEWWIPDPAPVADLAGYGDFCRDHGFEVAALEDLTDCTWRSFCDHLRRDRRWRSAGDRIRAAVNLYLLAALRKPATLD